jgi:hypothetical protein
MSAFIWLTGAERLVLLTPAARICYPRGVYGAFAEFRRATMHGTDGGRLGVSECRRA